MLILRQAQMAALNAIILDGFQERATARLLGRFPKRCRIIGETGVRALVRHGVGRAAAHGIEALPDLARYLDVMFTLGRDFDVNPAFPWAAERLSARASATERVDLLCCDVDAYLALRRLPRDVPEPP